jgi:hypothetical protein
MARDACFLKRAGLSEYSVRRDQGRIENFEKTWTHIETDPVNTRWQQAMAPYFAPLDPLRPGGTLPHDARKSLPALRLALETRLV